MLSNIVHDLHYKVTKCGHNFRSHSCQISLELAQLKENRKNVQENFVNNDVVRDNLADILIVCSH